MPNVIKRSVGIAGAGRIGTRCAYSVALSGVADAVVLFDVDKQRAISEASDIGDAVAYFPHEVIVSAGGYAELAACDIVVMAAGIQSDSKDRLSLIEGNLHIAEDIADNLKNCGFDGILVILTNPCDVLSFHISERMGLPAGRVFSTGTALDSARLKKHVARATGLEHNSLSAIVMGEHGASLSIPWSKVTVYGQEIGKLAETDSAFDVPREEIRQKVLNGAWAAVEGKGVAEYGVAAAFMRCAQAIFHDEKAVLPISTLLKGEYGVSDVFAGVPAVLGQNGVERVIELDLLPEELAEFRKSCDRLKGAIAQLKTDK